MNELKHRMAAVYKVYCTYAKAEDFCNDRAIRRWQTEIVDLPPSYGFRNDKAFICSYGNAFSNLNSTGYNFVLLFRNNSRFELYFRYTVSPQNIAAAEEMRNKRKMIKIVFYVTLSFLLCFQPALIVVCIRASGYTKLKADGLVSRCAWTLLFLEPVIKPVIYALQSTNFRGAFKEILKKAEQNKI